MLRAFCTSQSEFQEVLLMRKLNVVNYYLFSMSVMYVVGIKQSTSLCRTYVLLRGSDLT